MGADKFKGTVNSQIGTLKKHTLFDQKNYIDHIKEDIQPIFNEADQYELEKELKRSLHYK